MAVGSTINRSWIATEFAKGIFAEQSMAEEAKAHAQAAPELAVLYNEIAAADERHRTMVETIATRYGHTPSKNTGGSLGETLGRFRDKVGELGSTSLQRIGHDLMAKASAIHWCNAWILAFQTIGDAQSARELAAIVNEETAHRDALQESLNRLIARGALGQDALSVK